MGRITLEKITAHNLEQAIEIGKIIFPVDSEKIQCPEMVYRWSASTEDGLIEAETGGKNLEYYLAYNEAHTVVGVTGLYQEPDDPDSLRWLGWFGVVPEYRGRGYGRRILEATESLCLRMKVTTLKLWTTEDDEEAAAQILFEKKDYRIIGRDEDLGYKMLIRERKF